MIECPNCKKQISEKALKCPHCQYELVAKKQYCTECGAKLDDNAAACSNCGHPVSYNLCDTDNSDDYYGDDDYNNIQKPYMQSVELTNEGFDKNRRNRAMLIGGIGSVVLIVVISIILSQTVFLTDKQKDDRIIKTYVYDGYDAACDAVIKFYGDSSAETMSWLTILSTAEDDKLVDKVEVVEDDLTIRSSGNYYDYEAIVKNNSDKTLSYIELNIYLLDKNNDIIYSDWTNWTGSLPPGATTVIDAMIKDVEGTKFFRTSVEEVHDY